MAPRALMLLASLRDQSCSSPDEGAFEKKYCEDMCERCFSQAHSLVLGLHGTTPSSLALDGFHSCGIESLLRGWPASVN